MDSLKKIIVSPLLLIGVFSIAFMAWAHDDENHIKPTDTTYDVTVTPELVKRGKAIFANRCAMCHDSASKAGRMGPGLKGLYESKLTPARKHPVTDANIRDHIQKGGNKMPPFPGIKGESMDSLIAYLKTI